MTQLTLTALLAAALHGASAMRSEEVDIMLNTDVTERSVLEAAVNQSAGSPSYFVDMATLRLGYQKSFCGRTVADICETLENFPGSPTMNYLSWEEAERHLLTIQDLYESKEIYRGNELGYFIMNDGLWARDFKTIGIGATEAQHRMFRPIVDGYLGSAGENTIWSEQIIDESLAQYLQGKKTLNARTGIFGWTTRLMHKLHLNMDLSDADVKRFMDLQGDAIMKGVLPVCPLCSGIQDERDYFLKKYIAAIKADTRLVDTRPVFPPGLSDADLRFMASALMDSMLFAGGMSVGNLIKAGLSVLYGDPSGIWQDRKDFNAQLTEENVDQFVYELVRLFPAVIGFPWYPSPKKEVRFIANLATALRDKRVWQKSGPVLEFHLRPLELYKKYARIAWAEPANGREAWAVQDPGRTGKLQPMSRGCPGQALSFTIMKVFFKRWVRTWTQWHVIEAPKGGVTFEDHRPYVGTEVTVALVSKTGTLTLFDKGILSSKQAIHWAVLTHGDANHNGVLLVVDKGGYRHDDPERAAAKIVLNKKTTAKKDVNYIKKSDSVASCFIVSGGGLLSSSVRLCAEEAGNQGDNDAEATAWVNAINAVAASAVLP